MPDNTQKKRVYILDSDDIESVTSEDIIKLMEEVDSSEENASTEEATS